MPHLVILCDGMEVLIAVYSKNGMPYVVLSDLLNLHDLNELEMQVVDEVLLSNILKVDFKPCYESNGKRPSSKVRRT